MSPKDVVVRWVELFNAGDADGLAALYRDDAVNHQVAETPVEGRPAIREMFAREFAAATMTCLPEAIHEVGDVAILEWRDPLGLRGCGFFTVREGLIAFQRGYWDKLSFLRLQGLPVPGAVSLHHAIRGAATTRRFAPDPIDPAALRRALDHARFAPSAGNRQPWRVVVVMAPATRAAIARLYLPHWEAYLEETGAAGAVAAVPVLREADAFARALADVPVHVVVCGETALMHSVDTGFDRPPVTGGASIYPFVQNLLLALRSEELGAAFVTLFVRAEREARGLLGIPDEMQVCGLVAAGRRAAPWPRTLSRAPVEAFAFADRWGVAL